MLDDRLIRSKLERLMRMLPSVKVEGSKGRVLLSCRNLCCAACDCSLADTAPDKTPTYGPRSDALLRILREQAFPLLLTTVSRYARVEPVVASALVDAVVASSRVLRLGWPFMCDGARPDLVQAVMRFCRWVQAPTHRLTHQQTHGVLDFSAHVVAMIVQHAHPVDQLDTLLEHVFQMACALSARTVTVTNSNTDTTAASSSIARSLTTLFISRHFLLTQGLLPASASTASSVLLARHAMVAVSRSDLRMPKGIVAVRHLLEFLTQMDLEVVASPPPAPPGVTLVQFVRALHICAGRHTSLRLACSEVVKKQHLSSSGAEEFSAMRVTLHECLRMAVTWMLTQHTPGVHTLHAELEMLSNIVIQVASPTVRYDSYGDLRRARAAVIAAVLAKPGVIQALDALLRGTDVLAHPPNGMGRCLIGAASLVHLIVTGPAPTQDADVHRALNSLVVTVHKVLLRLLKVDGVAWGSMHMHMVTAVMINVVAALIGRAYTDPTCCRLFRLVGVCLRTLMRMANNSSNDHSTSSVPMSMICPDCDATPLLWLGCVQDFSRRFGGRLLLGCCSLDCKEMDGLFDSRLQTKLCQGCRRARYCSVACQRHDWAAGGHRRVCGLGE